MAVRQEQQAASTRGNAEREGHTDTEANTLATHTPPAGKSKHCNKQGEGGAHLSGTVCKVSWGVRSPPEPPQKEILGASKMSITGPFFALSKQDGPLQRLAGQLRQAGTAHFFLQPTKGPKSGLSPASTCPRLITV